jgi:hypothetical protein
MQWLEVKNIYWNGRHFQKKVTLPDDYEHHQCEQCGRSLNKDWVDEFGPVCTCGGKLTKVNPEELDTSQSAFYDIMRQAQNATSRGSAK